MNNFIKYLSIFLFLFIFISCEKKESQGPIKIAAIEPLSGPYAAVGSDLITQVEFYTQEINKNGGVLGGRKIEIVRMDNANKAEKTTELVRKSIDEGIKFIVQGGGSHVAKSIITQLKKHNSRNPGKEVLYLNHSAVTPSFTNEDCTFFHFRFDANTDMKVAALVQEISQDKEVNKVYLFNQNYAFGQSIKKTARKLLNERVPRVEIVGDELIPPFGKVTDFNPYVSKIKVSGADSIITGNWGPDAYRLVNALADAGVKVKIFGMYIFLPSSMPSMSKNALFNPIIQIKEATPYELEKLPNWLNEINIRHLEKTKMSSDTDRMRNMMEMFAKAINQSNSLDPVKIAYELEGMENRGPYGIVTMRKDDHQAHFDMVTTVVRNNNQNPMTYKDKNYSMAYSTLNIINKKDITFQSNCDMKRP